MALRLLEATVPSDDLGRIPGLLDEYKTLHVSSLPASDGQGVARILLDSEDAEAITDLLVQEFGTRDGFRITLLPVEATLPALERPEPDESASTTPEEPPKASNRISREELYEDIAHASETNAVYLVMVGLSTVVAAVGLLRGDVAVVIGAMVIAPLLGPNIGLALACTLGDPTLARRSLKAIATGGATAAALSFAMGMLLTVDPTGPQLAARTHPGVGDVLLALAAGSAGSLAFTSGVPAVVVGVMVAVALLPPLVGAGLLAGAGHWALAGGAITLALSNVAALNLAAVGTFLARKVEPRSWWESERAHRATRIAVTTWILMLATLVALILLTDFGG